MNKPTYPCRYIGLEIITSSDRQGKIEGIGNLSDDPWVLFPDNNVPIRMTWEEITRIVNMSSEALE